jgi:hypothetical protein
MSAEAAVGSNLCRCPFHSPLSARESPLAKLPEAEEGDAKGMRDAADGDAGHTWPYWYPGWRRYRLSFWAFSLAM